MFKKIIIFGLLISSRTIGASAQTTAPEIIASCGESSGVTYFHQNSVIPKEEAGWSKDIVRDGSFIVQKIGENYDLLFRDKLGLQSSTDNGAIILPTHSTQNSLNLVLIYPQNGNVEVYNFQSLKTDNAEVSWTSTKVGTLIVKSGVFHAKCANKEN